MLTEKNISKVGLCGRKKSDGPPALTPEQFKTCKEGGPKKEGCRYISGKKRWCGNFRVRIEQPQRSKIITPDKRIQYPSLPQMGKNFVKASARHVLSGMKKRTEAEQQTCIEICRVCNEFVPVTKIGPRCKKCGCNIRLKTLWSTSHCPLNKW